MDVLTEWENLSIYICIPIYYAILIYFTSVFVNYTSIKTLKSLGLLPCEYEGNIHSVLALTPLI